VSAIFVLTILLSAQDPAKSVLDQVARHYNAAVPFKVGFTISQAIRNTKNHTENSGTFFLGPGDRFRIVFTEEEIVYDGRWLWTRDKVNHQVIVEEFNPRSSLKLVSDILSGALDQFTITKTAKNKSGLTRLDLKPKAENGYIRALQLTITSNSQTVRSADYCDFQNNSVSIAFDSLISLAPADSGLFNIDLKKNEELIDLRP